MTKNFDFGRPMIGKEEQSAVADVLSGPILVHGPKARQFESEFAEFTGVTEAVTVSSCTAGMHLIYFALGYGPGDEVIVPAQTHTATAHAVALTGATPVFVDSNPQTGNIDASLIERAITSDTKAICVVHYLGVPADMELVSRIAAKHDLFVLEDCALAVGAKVNQIHVGLLGDAGAFSFYPVKHLTTAEGGMVVFKDRDLAKRIRLLRAFGVDRTHEERATPGMYDAVELGFNYRMSEIHAAIGVEQLKKLPLFLQQRKDNFELLENILKGRKEFRLLGQPWNTKIQSSHYCMGLILGCSLTPKRAGIMARLSLAGVGTSIYYPHPVPRMTYYNNSEKGVGQTFTNAEKISDSMIALPVGPHLNSADMTEIGKRFLSVIKDFV